MQISRAYVHHTPYFRDLTTIKIKNKNILKTNWTGVLKYDLVSCFWPKVRHPCSSLEWTMSWAHRYLTFHVHVGLLGPWKTAVRWSFHDDCRVNWTSFSDDASVQWEHNVRTSWNSGKQPPHKHFRLENRRVSHGQE